jgi:hypothetical protein
LCRSDLGVSVPSEWKVVRCSFIEHYFTQMTIFRCTGVVVQKSTAHCSAVYITLIVIASGYGYVGCFSVMCDALWNSFKVYFCIVLLAAQQEHLRQPQLVKQNCNIIYTITEYIYTHTGMHTHLKKL